MTATIKDLEELKARSERMRREADKAAGALEQTKKQLKEEFGVDTVEDAEKLLKKLEREEEDAREKFEEAHTKFMKEWGDVLAG